MKPFTKVFALIALAAVGSAPAAASGHRWALVVGVEHYKNSDIEPLRYAEADATSVASALEKSLGFNARRVRVMTSAVSDTTQPDCPTNVHVIDALNAMANSVGPDDTFVFYLSGHGFSRGDESFLGTIETDATSIDTLRLSTIPLSMLQNVMKRVKARQVVFMIDACRNDPERDKGGGENVRTAGFSKSLEVAARPAAALGGGSAVLFACADGQRGYEDPSLAHGAFTYYLVSALKGAAALAGEPLSAAQVAGYVLEKVTAWARQHSRQPSYWPTAWPARSCPRAAQ
ncbi:MAG: caspase family protein [Armatimonadetes bacterium]|nr:caspase family protein [Armatimonadota bacterium]MDE2207256.1 caspase family protein [Armatimonadota bacterium]